ncbi:uncharacterized protein LOC106457913 [Limulus polyphemus]|uniref:Uncharacterized protein LOC106457913 n=1 Tax=Limulus polyphemus TaxID=6850 RepID=A0ABM1S7U5_LIMPO|nr:uncharacterized protein LOC106457913 [Limulus polyphemus]
MMKRVSFGHLKATFSRPPKHQGGCLHANGDTLDNKDAEKRTSFEVDREQQASCTLPKCSSENCLSINRKKGNKNILTALRCKWRKTRTRKKRHENRHTHSLLCDSRTNTHNHTSHSETPEIGLEVVSFKTQKLWSKQSKSVTRSAVCPMPSPIRCVRRESSSVHEYENEEGSDQTTSAPGTNKASTQVGIGLKCSEPEEDIEVTVEGLCTHCTSCSYERGSETVLKFCDTGSSVTFCCKKLITDDLSRNVKRKMYNSYSTNRNSAILEKCVSEDVTDKSVPDSKLYSSPNTSSHSVQENIKSLGNTTGAEEQDLKCNTLVQRSENEWNISKSLEIPPNISSLALDVPSSSSDFQSKLTTFNACADVPDSSKTVSITEELFKLSKCGWYWGPITRSEAEEKLSDQSDGAFLVRDSSDDRYLLSLSFRSYGRTLHTRIEHCNGLFSFYAQPEPEGHSSIVDLIEQSMNYSQSGVFCYSRSRYHGSPSFPVRLTKPVSRFTQVRTLQYLCRFVIRQYTRFDHIQHLPLPACIKGYLEEGHY